MGHMMTGIIPINAVGVLFGPLPPRCVGKGKLRLGLFNDTSSFNTDQLWREKGREGERERGREREKGRGREGEREGERERGREGEREGRKEGRRERERQRVHRLGQALQQANLSNSSSSGKNTTCLQY